MIITYNVYTLLPKYTASSVNDVTIAFVDDDLTVTVFI